MSIAASGSLRRSLSVLPLVAVLLAPMTLQAQQLVDEATGTTFSPTAAVGGVTYKCLGAGVRKVYMFVKVYAATFCIDAATADKVVAASQGGKGSSADALSEDPRFFSTLIDQSGGKLVIMKLTHDITAEKMANAFREALGKILPAEKVAKLIATIPGDAKEGQQVQLYSSGNQLTIDIAGSKKTIDDAEIAQKLWYVWLGPEGVSPTLKKSIAKHAAGG